MSNDYFKAQGWFKNYATSSEDSRGLFQELVKEDEEAFRLASAKTDKIKAMMNEKYGPGTIKYGSEIKQPEVKTPQAIFEFSQRNPAAEGGRMRFDEGLSAKMSYNDRTKLLDSYHVFFKEAYDERINSGKIFGKADVARDVIKKIEIKYPDQADNLDFFPGRSKDLSNPASYYEYIDPKKQSSKFRIKNSLANTLTKEQMSVFKGNEARGLKTTLSQEKIFKALQNGINEIDDLVKETGMTKARINQETSKLVNNMFVRKNETPIFLRGEEAQNAIADVYNSLVDSKTMAGFHTRNIKSMIYDSFPNDPEIRKLALSKVKKFTEFTNDLKKQFPGLEINYDHPGSYRALKNLDFKNFLNVTPISKDINTFKSRFDNQSVKNLNNLADAKTNYGSNSPEYKAALKKQRSLERVWSNLTGNKSSLGKIRLNRQSTGTIGLETEGKNLVEEFTGNLKIREEIAKNIDESVKFYDPNSKTEKTIFESFEEVLPTKRGTTASIEAAKKITSSDSLDFDKKIMDYITDTTGKVKQPSFIGVSSGFNTDLIAEDLKKIMDTEGFKTFKANIADPALEAAGKAVKVGSKVAALPTKIFGGLDLVFGYFDYLNNDQKGYSNEDAIRHMIDATLINTTSFGETGDIKGVRKIANKNGMSNEVFNNLMAVNTNQKKFMDTVSKSKAKFNESMDIIESGAADPTAENMLIQKLKVDTKESLTNTMKNIVKDSRSLETNLQVQEAGAPININVDKEKAFSDLGSASRDFVQTRIDASDPKVFEQGDSTMGKIGNIFDKTLLDKEFMTKLAVGDYLGLADTKAIRNQKDMQKLKQEDPTMYYKMLQSKGIDPRINLNIPVQLEFEQKYGDIFGNQMSDKLTQNKAEGGITGLRSKYEYKK